MKTYTKTLLATLGTALTLSAVPASAATVLTSSGDTYIRSNQATTNFGSDAFMVANDNNSFVRMAVFSFDLSSVAVGSLTSAKLELDDVIGNASQTYEIWGLLDAHETFNESTLTWNSAGFVDGTDNTTVDASKAYGGALLGTFSNSQNTVNTAFDVTSGNFLDFLNASGDNDVTFVIVDPNNGTGGSGWATKEATGDLVPTLTVVPEPGSLALLGLGGLLIARRRRD